MEPLKWWILDNNLSVSEELGTSLDMSHAFTNISLSGDCVSLFLNRHLPLDLREDNFPVASSASSAIHHVNIKLLRISKDNYFYGAADPRRPSSGAVSVSLNP